MAMMDMMSLGPLSYSCLGCYKFGIHAQVGTPYFKLTFTVTFASLSLFGIFFLMWMNLVLIAFFNIHLMSSIVRDYLMGLFELIILGISCVSACGILHQLF